MIRINLLAVERERTKRPRGVTIPVAQRATIGASLILVATVLGVGWWFWSIRQHSIRLDEEIARAETQTQQLRSVLAQVQKFEARKAQLQQRVSLIEQLRSGQGGPVHVLDEISKSLPDRLWLTEMTQVGNEFTIGGMTTSMTAVSDFIANLEATRYFKRPVEIVDSQVQADVKAGDLVKFSVKAQFQDPSAPVAPVAPAAGRGRGGAAGAQQ
jgi:type IV pilus assembly protein PilN